MQIQISITGEPGCGKTTVAKIVCQHLGSEYTSTGSIQREIAAQMGITTLDLNKLAETDPSIDEKIDSHTRALADSGRSVLVDSRLAWRFLPRSLKVFLVCPPSVAASRVFDQNRANESYPTKEAAIAALIARYDSEKARFAKYYGANLANLRNYDLVIDTAVASPAQVAQVIITAAEQHASAIGSPASALMVVHQSSLLDWSANFATHQWAQNVEGLPVARCQQSWGALKKYQSTDFTDLQTGLVRCSLQGQDDEVIRVGVTARSLGGF